ncbi:signal recognition particle-docking protein FtsY [Texas Phoenix palm phytoplasma]|uniref:Signal recognition particle-docking protein FtsY n=1 Tax=Texas Phoenix palm phytoplasma TaxID=176709 RepID=A0ABS5BIU3_9MOLU|nr:signal recognition particle-docking protein FtsY [Texas Phoenix palm phytoplasma]MBP3059515.1 signal recognition particle-docking protein FtsY [Texas Phoenix palm phytoplasma]
MFEFFKKIFNKNKNEKKIDFLGIKNLEYNFSEWVKKIQKNQFIEISLLEELKILLIKSDIGIKTSSELIKRIKYSLEKNNIKQTKEFLNLIKEQILLLYEEKKNEVLKTKNNSELNSKKKIFLLVGVNGAGKTTTIGKLAMKFKQEGKKVLLVAGDTFRTGAIEQLKSWGEITNCEVFYKKKINSFSISPSNVIFEALSYAKNKNFDIVLCDTAGRLENKTNLMKELEKIKKIIKIQNPNDEFQKFLILDSMTGQNGLNQVNIFNNLISLNGVILTKLDGISKGGLILAIKHLYNIETKYIGIGEKVDDLIEFDIQTYVNNLFK